MKKKILIGLGVVVVVVVLLMATDVLKIKFNASVGDGGGKGVERDQVQWKKYKSTSIGYTLSHPAAWTVKEQTNEGGPDILIAEPKGFAFVRIRGLYDPALNSPEAIKASIEAYKKSFASQDVTLTNFKSGDVQNEVGGFVALGEFAIDGVPYRFEERGLLSTNSKVLLMRAAASPNAFDLAVPLMRQIMDSFTLE